MPDSITPQLEYADNCIDVPVNVGRIYKHHQPWLLNWLKSKLHCPQDAHEMSHDTFLRLLNGDVRGLREPRAYLLVIANRLMINRFKRSKVEQEALAQVAVLLESQDQKGPAEILVMQDLLHRVLLMLTEELPEKPRKAFLMARLDGLSYTQIAERLEVSESSVKQYLAKVIMHCHKRLYAEFGEGV